MAPGVRERAKHRWRAAALAPLLAAACGGSDADPGPPSPLTTCPIPVAVIAPTFAGHVLPMLGQTCGANSATSCHGTPSPVGHVSYSPSLTATQVWSQLVNVEPANAPLNAGWKRIAPNDVGHSWLIEKVTKDDPGGVGQAYGNRMPYGLPNLCDATVQTLVNWIDLGALND